MAITDRLAVLDTVSVLFIWGLGFSSGKRPKTRLPVAVLPPFQLSAPVPPNGYAAFLFDGEQSLQRRLPKNDGG